MRRSWLGGPPCWAAFVLVLLALVAHAAPAAAAPGPDPRAVPIGRWPLTGSPRVLHGFAPPAHRYGPGHRGVDLAARRGDPVLAALGGRVAFAGRVAGRGVVSIDTGGLRTTYEPVAGQVAVGDVVRAGQPVGVLGTGGHCSGSCLHWGLRSGSDYLDPLLVVGGGTRVALVPAGRRAAVQRSAAERARLAEVATAGLGAGWIAGPGDGTASPTPSLGPSPHRSASASIHSSRSGNCTTEPTSAWAAAPRSGPPSLAACSAC